MVGGGECEVDGGGREVEEGLAGKDEKGKADGKQGMGEEGWWRPEKGWETVDWGSSMDAGGIRGECSDAQRCSSSLSRQNKQKFEK